MLAALSRIVIEELVGMADCDPALVPMALDEDPVRNTPKTVVGSHKRRTVTLMYVHDIAFRCRGLLRQARRRTIETYDFIEVVGVLPKPRPDDLIIVLRYEKT